jgi:hypothetical protein
MLLDIFDLYEEIIDDYEIISFRSEAGSYELIAVLQFVVTSELYIKEYLFQDTVRKYAYHWQTDKGKLIIRWDNARHWKNISAYPHHKHYGVVGKVKPSEEHTLEKVLEFIKEDVWGQH